MEIVAIVVSLFSLMLSVVTFIAFVLIVLKKETDINVFARKQDDEPNRTEPLEKSTELENFTPDFEKPLNIKYL